MYGGILKQIISSQKLSLLLLITFVFVVGNQLNGATTAKAVVAKTPAAKLAATAKTTAKTAAKATANKVDVKKKKKAVKIRSFVVDTKVIGWAKYASDAESAAMEAAMKVAGLKGKFLVKDTVFTYDSKALKYACVQRINFTDEMPETWYLETEMASGFGSNYERAYNDAVQRAVSRAKSVRDNADWAAAQSTSTTSGELTMIPYEITFCTAGKEYCCKLYFRYFMPRKK